MQQLLVIQTPNNRSNRRTLAFDMPFVLKHLIVTFCLLLISYSALASEPQMNNTQLKPCPDKPNCVSSQSKNSDHFIEPLLVDGNAMEARSRLLEVIKNLPRTEILQSEADFIHATFTSLIFRFVDDVEFVIEAESDGKTLIHVRSASRVGYSDLGANRKRVEQIRSLLNSSDN